MRCFTVRMKGRKFSKMLRQIPPSHAPRVCAVPSVNMVKLYSSRFLYFQPWWRHVCYPAARVFDLWEPFLFHRCSPKRHNLILLLLYYEVCRQLPGEKKEWHCSSCAATLTVATVGETKVLIVLVEFFHADPPFPQSQSGYHASCYAMWSFANIFRQFMNPKIKEWTKNLQSGVAASIAFNHRTQWRTIYRNLEV